MSRPQKTTTVLPSEGGKVGEAGKAGVRRRGGNGGYMVENVHGELKKAGPCIEFQKLGHVLTGSRSERPNLEAESGSRNTKE